MTTITEVEKHIEFTIDNNAENGVNINASKWKRPGEPVKVKTISFVVAFISCLIVGFITLGAFFYMSMTFFLAGIITFAITVAATECQNISNETYRMTKGDEIEKALNVLGWKIDYTSNRLDSFRTTNNLFLRNADGVRYYIQVFSISQNAISFTLGLSDTTVEKAMKTQEKKNRINYLVEQHQSANGIMTTEEKNAFTAGVRMSLNRWS